MQSRPNWIAVAALLTCPTCAIPVLAQERVVARAVFTTDVRDREPVDRLERPPGTGATIYFFTELVGLNGRRVAHVWLRDGTEVYRRTFDVGSSRWRAWSGAHLTPGPIWSVRVVVEGGAELGTWRLGEPRTAAPPPPAATPPPAREPPRAAPPPRPEPPPPAPTPERPPVQSAVEDVTIDVYRDLVYVPEGWPMGLSAAQNRATGLAGTPYEILRRDLRLEGTDVRYGFLPLGSGADTRITFVVSDIDQPTWTLHVDRNDNEDLTDDGPPIRSEGTGRFSAKVPVEVEVAGPDGAVSRRPYQVWLWFVESEDQDPSRAEPRFFARCHYAGTVRLGEETFNAIAYEERAQNGLFADDPVCIDLDRDGRCTAGEQVKSGETIEAAGRRFRIVVRDR